MNVKKYQAAILALLIIVVYNAWVSPARSELANQKEQLANTQNQLEELNLVDIDSSQTQLSSLDKEILDKAIPKNHNQDQLIVQLQELMDKHQVFNNGGFSFQQSAADTKNQIKMMQFSFSGSIGLDRLQNFVKDLETHDRFFDIQSMNFSIESIEDKSVANFNLSLQVYFS